MSEEQVYTILQQLATQLQTTVEHLWGVLVRQAYIDGVVMLVFMLVFTVFIIHTVRNIVEFVRIIDGKSEKSDEEQDSILLSTFLSSTFSFIGVIYILAIFGDMLTAFFNPEFYALQKIFEMLN